MKLILWLGSALIIEDKTMGDYSCALCNKTISTEVGYKGVKVMLLGDTVIRVCGERLGVGTKYDPDESTVLLCSWECWDSAKENIIKDLFGEEAF